MAALDPRWRELLSRKHVGVHLGEIRPQERPRFVRKVIRRVNTDVAAPYDGDVRLEQLGSKCGGLRIVQHDNITRTRGPQQAWQIALRGRFVMVSLSRCERTAVTGGAIEVVVDPLRDREERRIAVDHEPSRVDPDSTGVREQRLQQLGDSAARSSRVHVKHAPTVETFARARGGAQEPFGPVGSDDLRKPIQRRATNVDRL
jgi:hypothetical protein